MRARSRAFAATLGAVFALGACNELFDIDAPVRAGSAGPAGSASGGSSGSGTTGGSGGVTGGAGGAAGRGGGESGGAGGSMGGATGGSTTGGRGSTTGGTAGDTGDGGEETGSTGGSGAGSGGGAGTGGSDAGTSGAGGTAGTAGSAGTAGTGGVLGPCDGPSFRGGELVEIPGGTGIIGADDINDNTLPVIMEEFEDFCLDRTEVTVADYAQCIADGACDPQGGEAECNRNVATRGDHPVTCVTHEHAQQFCAWAGKRLPTEKEWEYAARGPEGRKYPWGADDPSAELLNYANNVNETTVVGSYASGATPETGLVDMAGNVWEWTASAWCEDYSANPACTPDSFVARGGSFASTSDLFVRPSWRDPDSNGDHRFGFRCAAGAGNNP